MLQPAPPLWLEAVRKMILQMHPPPPPSAHKSVLGSAKPRMDSECASGSPWSTAWAIASFSLGKATNHILYGIGTAQMMVRKKRPESADTQGRRGWTRPC